MSEQPISISYRLPVTTLDRADVLTDTEAFLRRFVVLTDVQAATIALWIAHTHAIEAAECTPYIHVTSTQPRAGKTRLLEVCHQLVRSPLRSADITESAIFHVLSEQPCTLLLDEVDTVFGGGRSREPLRALLNASYRRDTPVLRVKGNRVRTYEVFGPKMIAGIGEVPATVADRSIRIVMERKERGVAVQRWNMRDVEAECDVLRGRLRAAFAPMRDNLSFMREVAACKPNLPEFLHDRAADSWEPIFAIADCVGEGWGQRAREASRELSGGVDWREAITDTETGPELVR